MRRKPATDQLKQIGTEMAAIANAMRGADESTLEALALHLDELVREHSQATGLLEDEIARIEQEAEEDHGSLEAIIAASRGR